MQLIVGGSVAGNIVGPMLLPAIICQMTLMSHPLGAPRIPRMFRKAGWPGSEPLLYQQGQRAVGRERGLRVVDRVAQRDVSLADADAEGFDRNGGLNDSETRPVAHEPGRDRSEFHEGITATACQVIECRLDRVIGIDAHPRSAIFGDQSIGDGLAGIALLHPDDPTLEIGNAMHVRVAADIDNAIGPRPHRARRNQRVPAFRA